MFVPHTDAERDEMLKVIGAERIEDLFTDVPENYRFPTLDLPDGLTEIPVCVSYKINGKKTSEIPAQSTMYDKIECTYEKLPGWKGSTAGVVEYDKLPVKAKEYLAFVEKETGAKIAMVSTGPGREETMFLPEFATEMQRMKGAEGPHEPHEGVTKARK